MPDGGSESGESNLKPDLEITSRRNDRVRHLKELGASAQYRREWGEFLCDGMKLLEEAVKWGADIREVLTSEDVAFDLPPFARLYRAPRDVVESASPLRSPQGVIFSVAMPEPGHPESLAGSVILEDVRDPGNLGAVLRTANAFGIENVVLTGSCADLYNPKTVRASMGAIFRRRAVAMTLHDLADMSAGTPIYGAALHREAKDLRQVDLSRAAVAIGNEGSGLSDELLAICAGAVLIPMTPGAESLNAAVAASIIMWEMGKSRL